MAFQFPESMAGKNTFTFKCSELNAGTSYAICLFTIQAYVEKRLGDRSPKCSAAIKAKTCPALKLLAREKKEGKVLFYKERPSEELKRARVAERSLIITLPDRTDPALLRAMTFPKRSKDTRKKLPRPVPKDEYEIPTDASEDMAAALTAAVAKESKKLSPLEIAKMKRMKDE